MSLVRFGSKSIDLSESSEAVLKVLVKSEIIPLVICKICKLFTVSFGIKRENSQAIKSFLDIKPIYHRRSARTKAHVYLCALRPLISGIINGRTKSHLLIDRRVEILEQINAIPMISQISIVYRSESDEAMGIFNELKFKVLDQILTSALLKHGRKYH